MADSGALSRKSAGVRPSVSPLVVGDRVAVGTNALKGVLKFIGGTDFAEGEWMGVELDTPNGKNDGSVKGVSYFTCKPNHGLFVRRSNVAKEEGKTKSTSPLKRTNTNSSVNKKRDTSTDKEGATASPLSSPGVADTPRTAKAGQASPTRRMQSQKSFGQSRPSNASASQATAAAVAAAAPATSAASAAAAAAAPDVAEAPAAAAAPVPAPAPAPEAAATSAAVPAAASKAQQPKGMPETIQIDDESDYEEGAVNQSASILELESQNWSLVGDKCGSSSSVHPSRGSALQDPAQSQKPLAHQELATAVEEHDAERIRAALPLARAAGVKQQEIDIAQRMLNWEVNNSLLKEMDSVRSAVARLAQAVEAAESRAEAAERRLGLGPGTAQRAAAAQPPSGRATTEDDLISSLGKQLEQRVWDGLERRMETAIQGAVALATRELLAAAAEVGCLRGGAQAPPAQAPPAQASPAAASTAAVAAPAESSRSSVVFQSGSRQETARATVRMSLYGACLRPPEQRDSGCGSGAVASRAPRATAGLYGDYSRRWRSAVRRVMRVRFTASALSRVEQRFTAASAVGALEASLAEDEEFERIMSQWGQKGSKRSTVTQASAGLEQRYESSSLGATLPGDGTAAPPRYAAKMSFAQPRSLPSITEGAAQQSGEVPPSVPNLTSSCVRNQARASVALALAGASRLSCLRELSQGGGEALQAPREGREVARASIMMALRGTVQKLGVMELEDQGPPGAVSRCVVRHVLQAASQRVRLLEAQGAMPSEATSAIGDIQACMRRMEAARATIFDRVDKASSTIQARFRGAQARREAHERTQGVIKLQHVFRRMQANRKACPGIDFYRVALLLRKRNKATVETFLEVASAGSRQAELGLDESGFTEALTQLHARISFDQAKALWVGFQEGVREGNMGLRVFCNVCEAVATGDSEAAEYADMTVEMWQSLGRPRRSSAQRMSREVARSAVEEAREREDSMGLPTGGRAAAAQLCHWEPFFRQGMDESAFMATLRGVRPTPSKAQLKAIWDARAACTGGAPLDFADFALIAEAVVTDAHAAAEFADMSEEHYLLLGADGAEAAAAQIQATFRGRQTRQSLRPAQQAAAPAEGGRSLEAAATQIQATFRGRQTRQSLRPARQAAAPAEGGRSPEAAATQIQATFRGRQTRLSLRPAQQAAAPAESGRSPEAAATQIQATFRGRQTRQSLRPARQAAAPAEGGRSPEAAATQIQAAFRGSVARRTFREEEVAACHIQAVFRGQQERKAISAHFKASSP